MSKDKRPKHKTFRVVEEYNVQVSFDVEVPVVYDDDDPLAYVKKGNCYVPPEDVVEDYKHDKVGEDWEFLGTLETKEI
tara:strand:+ start:662 stop:895 length:234 start_codon:yes stop_codon:yes gene_type:complete